MKIAKSITEEPRKLLQSYRNEDVKTVVNVSFDFDVVEVLACIWAIFSCEGAFPIVLQDTWGKFLSEWLISSNYELINVPEISFNSDMSDMQNVYSEIWIGVKEK